ncbi:uncharacterized protein ACNLHF_025120 [Anomaloglossus baeobatrachus]|uniref:uncharacterized protein LOC142246485 n=1 Tax=Anomaloglossus baeobatrachus TaxID=238106 RepID=UPI003F507191
MKLCEERRRGHIHDGAGIMRATTLLLLLHTCCALEITAPSSQVGILHTDALLPCTFKVETFPVNLQYLAILWHFGEKEIARYDTKTKGSTSRFVIDEPAAKQGNASLTIRHVTITDKGTYTCTVVYSPNTDAKKIQLNILAVPVVKIQKNAVQKGVTSLFQCSITNFFPKDMKVTWLKNGNILSASTQEDKTNADMTFTRNSSVNVPFLEVTGNPKITCKVEHEYLQDPIEDSYIVKYGAAPTVSIKTSKSLDGNDQIYMCEAMNYSPEEVTMRWLLDGKRIDFPPQNNNGYFNKEIYHLVQLYGNNPPSEISCEVQHETLNSPIRITEEVKLESDCKRSCHFGIIGVLAVLLVISLPGLWYFMKKDLQKFQVGHIHRVQTGDDKVTFYCTASNCPNDVRVTWTIVDSNKEKIIVTDDRPEGDEEAALIARSDYKVETDRSREDNIHHAISTLSFTPIISKHKEIQVSCAFLCNKQTQEKSITSSFTFKKPEMPDRLQMSLGDNGDVLCSVFLQNFYPKDIEIKWSHGLGHFQEIETLSEKYTKNDDFTFNVRSECRVPGHLFKDQGFRVQVKWSHENETGQQEVSITDSLWRPVMGEIEKPAFTDGKEANLRCTVSGYFPDVLDVKWLRRNEKSQEFCVMSDRDKYKIPVMEATQQEDKTFTYTACLNVSVSAATDYGAEYMCRVKHPTLKTPLEKRTGAIRVIGIRAVNVKRVDTHKMRAEVSHFTPNKIKITWSRTDKGNKNYEEYKDASLTILPNNDGSHTTISDMTMKTHKETPLEKKYYKVVVEHAASSSVIEKIVLRESGGFYLSVNDKKSPLEHIFESEQEGSMTADNQVSSAEQPTEETSQTQEKKGSNKSGLIKKLSGRSKK